MGLLTFICVSILFIMLYVIVSFACCSTIRCNVAYAEDDESELLTTSAWALTQFISILDHASYILTAEEAKEAQECVQLYLLSWQKLASDKQRVLAMRYKIRPKHHYLQHIGLDLLRTRLNPRYFSSCFDDESFLGNIKRIAVKCHGATTCIRVMRRHLLFLRLQWHKRRQAM
jgi:hypothetical protein